MNTAPFYELHDRLYDCAYAGCASISEDFRLKRAVEGMIPLAEANKTFARLRDMCARLFTEPEPALLLADCIALADALAVAQGSCTNIENSRPGTLEYSVDYNMEAGWRSVRGLWSAILTQSQHLENLDPHEYSLLGDPRILEQFICAAGERNKYLNTFADKMCAAYGSSIVPLLKRSLDLSDEKASGMQVDYVSSIAGSAENAWYLSLAENTEAPQNVRIKAIQALGRDRGNAARLLDLCRTEKGKVKNAALLETSRLDPPGFEAILAKLTAKYKDSSLPIVCASPSGTAKDFVRRRLDEAELSRQPELKFIMSTIDMMANKRDIDDCLLRGLELARKFYRGQTNGDLLIRELNVVLIEDLFVEPAGSYREMTIRLHEKEPEAFFPAWCITLLQDDPDTAAKELKKRTGSSFIFAVLEEGIRYSGQHGRYILDAHIPVAFGSAHDRKFVIPLFERMPGPLAELLSETSALKGTPQDVIYKTASRCEFLNKAVDSAAPDDIEMIKAEAVKFAYSAMKKAPLTGPLDIIIRYGSPDSDEIFRLMRTHAMFPYNAPGSAYKIAKTTLLTAEQKRSILLEMQKKVLTGTLSHYCTIAGNLLDELSN